MTGLTKQSTVNDVSERTANSKIRKDGRCELSTTEPSHKQSRNQRANIKKKEKGIRDVFDCARASCLPPNLKSRKNYISSTCNLDAKITSDIEFLVLLNKQ